MFYVFDTDIIGFLMNDYLAVVQHLNSLNESDEAVTTIVTFGETMSGLLPACKKAKNGEARAEAYGDLLRALNFYRDKDCLPFNDTAVAIFDRLKKQIKIGTNDLAIAAITLSVNGTLVTRNFVDFERVPGLPIEDWTK
jgi:tRNA(fMet)-specific endonuclease VapC